MAQKNKPRIAANGYRLCDPLPAGEVLRDSHNKEWVLGKSIGSGGFGDIYSCKRKGDRKEEFVIKLDNISGPLFQEMNFYMRTAKEEQINAFMRKHKLKFLGMPRFIANGIHDKSSVVSNKRNKDSNLADNTKRNAPTLQYRFLVMQRFGEQLEDFVDKKKLNASQTADVAVKMIDVLEYIHSFGYIHADIKGTNILKSMSTSKTANDWYLVDFGLAERYCAPDGKHREEKPDKKRANNGTVEYRSRDAHIGLLSRRSDIECLAYNLIQWLYGTLPWMSYLNDAKKVETLKAEMFANLDKSLGKCFEQSVPNGLKEFFKEINEMNYQSEPDYQRLKDILIKKLSKTKTTLKPTDISNGDDSSDVEKEVVRKVIQSSSESTVDEIRMNSPRKRIDVRPSKTQKVVNNKRNRGKGRKYVELSDSDDDSVSTESPRSPPKRTRTVVVASSSGTSRNGHTFKTPERKSPRRPIPRFSTPLLFEDEEDDDDNDDSQQSSSSSSVIELNKSRTSDTNNVKTKNKTSLKVSNLPVETPAMKEMRERMEQKRLEKLKLKKKK